MNEPDKIQTRRLRSARTVNILVSLVAIGAVSLAVYAFKQKKTADSQTLLAQQRAIEALQQQKIVVEQRNIADSNKELAIQQREIALENERTAIQQKEIANAETEKAKQSQLEALQQKNLAEQQKNYAERQKAIAEANAEEVIKQQKVAEEQRKIAKEEKQTSVKLKDLATSRNIANEAILLLNQNLADSSKDVALRAFTLNKINNGPAQNNDIYNALNINWIRSINNKNKSAIHKLPVHCIAGLPNSDIIFSADESGMLYECSIKNNSLQKISSYAIKEEVRALAISPDGKKLIAASALGNGIILNVSASGISAEGDFNFPGTGKTVSFINNEDFILLADKGIGRYDITNITSESFVIRNGVNAFTIGKSGKIYLATGRDLKIYKDWNNAAQDKPASTEKFGSRITSVAVDADEHYLAAGTYNGSISIIDLRSNTTLWNKVLHLSSVNDLKFARVDNNILQLASAGADQTIKLIDVDAILQKNSGENIITLNGHTNWIYALYYTAGADWLFSAGEDSKIIAWKPSMNNLYQTLKQ
jgi:WD40 repeat protein